MLRIRTREYSGCGRCIVNLLILFFIFLCLTLRLTYIEDSGRRSLRHMEITQYTEVKTERSSPSKSIPVFFINLDRSSDRRQFMEQELSRRNLPYKRIRAVTGAEAVQVQMEVQLVIPPIPQEIACIASHLLAMWEAITDDTLDPFGQYAVIMEDDVAFQFDVNFEKLIASAPADFGILQLTTSNSYEVTKMWADFEAASRSAPELVSESLWRLHTTADGLWSTQAYIIKKASVRAFVERAIRVDEAGRRRVRLKPAGKQHCATTASIAGVGGGGPLMRRAGQCVQPFRMVADMYLYAAFAPVYTLRVPIMNGAAVGNVSTIPTLNKNKDASAASAFLQIGETINRVKAAIHLLPDFLLISSSEATTVSLPLSSAPASQSPPVQEKLVAFDPHPGLQPLQAQSQKQHLQQKQQQYLGLPKPQPQQQPSTPLLSPSPRPSAIMPPVSPVSAANQRRGDHAGAKRDSSSGRLRQSPAGRSQSLPPKPQGGRSQPQLPQYPQQPQQLQRPHYSRHPQYPQYLQRPQNLQQQSPVLFRTPSNTAAATVATVSARAARPPFRSNSFTMPRDPTRYSSIGS